MRANVTTVLSLVIIFNASVAGAQNHLWSQRFGGTGNDVGWSVAVDGSGNVVAAGSFEGTVNFGGGNLISGGNRDFFLVKYDVNGLHQWSKRFGGTSWDEAYDVTVDASGNVFVVGSFLSSVMDLGGGNLVNAGQFDAFVAKYDANGLHQWSKRLGGTVVDNATDVAVDALGNVVVLGYFANTANFGGGSVTSAGQHDVFIAKYDAVGTHVWSKRLGGTGGDFSAGVALTTSGDVVVTGYFQNSVDFGGGTLVSAGSDDIFVAMYNSTGTHQWSRRCGGTLADNSVDAAVDGYGNVVVTGVFRGTVDFGGGPLASAGDADVFVASYDASGVHQWSMRFGDTLTDRGTSVAVDGSGRVTVTGFFQGSVDFGGGALGSAGLSDIFLAMYDAGGAHLWSQRFGSTSNDYGYCVAVSGFGETLATGEFQGSVDFGGGSLNSAGGSDILLAKYGSPPTAVSPRVLAILAQNYPNPFNPRTTIEYAVAEGAPVSIEIFDATGARVRVLDEGVREVGSHRTEWDGRDSDGRAVASGVYFYRLSGTGGTQAKKMVLLK